MIVIWVPRVIYQTYLNIKIYVLGTAFGRGIYTDDT